MAANTPIKRLTASRLGLEAPYLPDSSTNAVGRANVIGEYFAGTGSSSGSTRTARSSSQSRGGDSRAN